jgi:hypothetical protein
VSTLGRTGAQTQKQRKAGSRIRNPHAFGGPEASESGRALDEDIDDPALKKRGSGFRKQANRSEPLDHDLALI